MLSGYLPELYMGLSSLMVHKLRSLLTMLGMIFGVGAVVAMLSITAGVEKEMLAMIDQLGVNNIIIEAREANDPNELQNVRAISPAHLPRLSRHQGEHRRNRSDHAAQALQAAEVASQDQSLIRDVTRHRTEGARISRAEAELSVKAFIHNVHRFADEYYREDRKCPAQNVIVFDEAQRAWDAEQNRRAKRPEISESEMMLEIMDRHEDWSVIVALVGGGQEINRGEAGLSEWGRALLKFPHWKVLASPYVLSEMSPTEFRLFEETHPGNKVQPVERLHLRISTRSIRAQKISDWVDATLSGRRTEAGEIAEALPVKPALTRSLTSAKLWLTGNRRGTTRSGLTASAYAARLRADGLEPDFEFHRGFDWEHWFLDFADCESVICDHKYCNDVRASSKLEVMATQFEIQGLELDWVGVCWGEDLLWEGEKWECRRFNNKKWRDLPEHAIRKRSYQMNAYRVLLTRARQNMVLYIPQPTTDDRSRLPFELDRTADFLLACGAQLFE